MSTWWVSLFRGKRRTSERNVVTSGGNVEEEGGGTHSMARWKAREFIRECRFLASRDLFARAKSLETPAAYCTLGIPTAGVFCVFVPSRILIYQFDDAWVSPILGDLRVSPPERRFSAICREDGRGTVRFTYDATRYKIKVVVLQQALPYDIF